MHNTVRSKWSWIIKTELWPFECLSSVCTYRKSTVNVSVKGNCKHVDTQGHIWANTFFLCVEHKGGIYNDHRVQISTSMILTNALHPRLDMPSDFPIVHHRGRSRSGCRHVTSDLPLGSQWESRLCLGSPCPLMWWLQAVGFAWTHLPLHFSPLDHLHYSYTLEWVWGEPNMEMGARRFKIFSDHKELQLNLTWRSKQRDKAVLKEVDLKQGWRSMENPLRLGGDHIYCKVTGESMWFPCFTLPLWEQIPLYCGNVTLSGDQLNSVVGRRTCMSSNVCVHFQR